MLLLASSVCGLFKWRQFELEVILLEVGWYLRFSLSYRDVGSGANFLKCMFLSGTCFPRVQAAKTLAHISGAVVAFPLSGLRLN